MTAIAQLNQEPVNQEAHRLLKKAGVSPDLNQLHSLQLAQWRLDQERPNVKDPGAVQSLLDTMYRCKPQDNHRFLLDLPEKESLPEDLAKVQEPKRGGNLLLQQLHSRGSETFPRFAAMF